MAKKGFRFPGPVPKDALEFFRAKKLRPSFSFLDVTAEEHALQFTVAKSTGFDILGDVAKALGEHLEGGGTLRTFERDLTPILQEKGWWGRRTVEDPETGEQVEAQLGSPRRLRTIFRSNMRSARAAGQWARIQRTKRTHPYLLYRLGPSREHRKEHVAWNGVLLPVDDPWWRDHFTPNGWGCKCWIRQVSKAEYERLRRDEGILTERPPRDEVEWTNPRTGRKVRVDRGLDPSWAGNPGLRRQEILLDRLAAKLTATAAAIPAGAGEALARAEVREIVESPLLDRQMAIPQSGEERPPLPVGWLEPLYRRTLGSDTGVIVLDSKAVRHLAKSHKNITATMIRAVLPRLLLDPELALHVRGHRGRIRPSLAFFGRDPDGNIHKVVVRIDGVRLRLVTLHESSARNAQALLQRDLVNDDPSQGRQAVIVSGSLGALR